MTALPNKNDVNTEQIDELACEYTIGDIVDPYEDDNIELLEGRTTSIDNLCTEVAQIGDDYVLLATCPVSPIESETEITELGTLRFEPVDLDRDALNERLLSIEATPLADEEYDALNKEYAKWCRTWFLERLYDGWCNLYSPSYAIGAVEYEFPLSERDFRDEIVEVWPDWSVGSVRERLLHEDGIESGCAFVARLHFE